MAADIDEPTWRSESLPLSTGPGDLIKGTNRQHGDESRQYGHAHNWYGGTNTASWQVGFDRIRHGRLVELTGNDRFSVLDLIQRMLEPGQ